MLVSCCQNYCSAMACLSVHPGALVTGPVMDTEWGNWVEETTVTVAAKYKPDTYVSHYTKGRVSCLIPFCGICTRIFVAEWNEFEHAIDHSVDSFGKKS